MRLAKSDPNPSGHSGQNALEVHRNTCVRRVRFDRKKCQSILFIEMCIILWLALLPSVIFFLGTQTPPESEFPIWYIFIIPPYFAHVSRRAERLFCFFTGALSKIESAETQSELLKIMKGYCPPDTTGKVTKILKRLIHHIITIGGSSWKS